MRRERGNHTLQPTALVHDAYMQLVDQSRVDWKGRTHFYAVAAIAMRRLLQAHARRRNRLKRGGGWKRIAVDETEAPAGESTLDVASLTDALERLAASDPRKAAIVEMRFFAGLSEEEIAVLRAEGVVV